MSEKLFWDREQIVRTKNTPASRWVLYSETGAQYTIERCVLIRRRVEYRNGEFAKWVDEQNPDLSWSIEKLKKFIEAKYLLEKETLR